VGCRSSVVRQVVLETFVHATEDEDKVVKAVEMLIPPSVNPRVVKLMARGYHGNPIEVLRYFVVGCEAEAVVRHVLSNMDELERSVLMASIQDRVEDNRLFLSFSKQSALLGSIEVGRGDDVIRVIVSLNTLALRGRRLAEALSGLLP